MISGLQLKAALKSNGGNLLFTVNEVKDITTFFSNSIVKNFTAYKYVFNEIYEEKEVIKLLNIGTPIAPPALMLGVQQ